MTIFDFRVNGLFGMRITIKSTCFLLFQPRIAILAILLFGGGLHAQYCTSNATSTADSDIDAFSFNTISTSNPGVCATYTDFTNLSTNVSVSNNYPISVTPGTCGGNFTKNGKVYIDYNGDGDFVDPGEEVFSFGPVSAPTAVAGTVTIPATASSGSTRMRVVCVETSVAGSIQPCGTYTWGETEDYTVIIAPSSNNDMGVTAINGLVSGCSLGSDSIRIDVNNFGILAQNAWTVGYSVNGSVPVIEPMTGPLASGTSVPYTFSVPFNFAPAGVYTVKAWTTLATDTVPQNDTTSFVVTSVPNVNTFPYVEDFEGGQGGWIPGGGGPSWAFGTPAKTTIQGAASGVNAFVTGGLGTGQYNPNEDSEVIGPCFDFTNLQNPWFSMNIWWHSEDGWDGSNLQSSTDFGLSWQTVGNAFDPGNWYNQATLIGTPGGVSEGWGGGAFTSGTGSNGWVTAAHRLDGLAGQPSVLLRVTFGSDGSVQEDGVGFDDVRISEGPVINLGADTLFCGGDTVFLDAGPGFAGYNWSNGATSQIDTIVSGGNIGVQVTDTNGFFDFDTILVSISAPSVNLGPDSTICPGDTVILEADTSTAYFWQDSTTNQTLAITQSGQYFVTVTDSVGCQARDTMNLTLSIPPSLNLGSDTTVCAGNPVLLDAGTGPVGTVYQWSSGAGTQQLQVSSPGIYVASVTTPGGCAAVDTVEVINFPSPGVNLGIDRTECGSFMLDAGGGATTYAWSNNMNTQMISLNQGGIYSVTVTNSFGCQQADTVNINLGIVPTVNLGQNLILCNGQSLTLDAGNPGSTFFWSTAAITQSIQVSIPGVYIVEVTDQFGCKGYDSIRVDQSLLAVDLGPDLNICGNGGVVLDAGNPGMTYNWSTGASSQDIFVNSPGTYTVTVSDLLGCDAIDNVIVNQLAGITAGITGPGTGALLQPVQFNDATAPGASQWIWNFGDGTPFATQQNPQHVFAGLGQFTVTLIASDGICRDTTTMTIDVSTVIGLEEEIGASSFELYPNPSDGLFQLSFELYQAKKVTIDVMDLGGRVLLSKAEGKVLSYQDEIDLGHLPKGIYLLKVSVGEGATFRKLILQ